MSSHSVAEAKNQLSELIDRSLRGEGVIITRHGRPVVELKPILAPPKPVSAGDLDWLAKHRVGRNATTDAGSLLKTMRDEEER